MGAFAGPEMATDGLILSLDAGNPKCFSEGATSATNIITGGAVTGASGQPDAGAHTPNTANFPAYNSINGGIFDFAGGRGMNCDEDLGAHTEFTSSMWFYKPSGAQNAYFTDGRNDGGQWFISNYSPTEGNYEYTAVLTYNYGSPYTADPTEYIGKWIYMVVVSNASTARLYLNGSEVPDYDGQASLNENLGINFRIGTRFTTSGQWTGYMNQINIYDRVLTEDEITKNFWATRGRYGI